MLRVEGSIAVTGSLIQWLRDNLGMISSAAEVEELAKLSTTTAAPTSCPHSPDCLRALAADARGVIVGLTRFINRGHLARAALEASVIRRARSSRRWKPTQGVRADDAESRRRMVVNDLLMQFQADVLGVPVIRPVVNETTALGAAYAAGLAVGYWRSADDIHANWAQDKQWDPGCPTTNAPASTPNGTGRSSTVSIWPDSGYFAIAPGSGGGSGSPRTRSDSGSSPTTSSAFSRTCR